MSPGNELFYLVMLTVLITRILLYRHPTPGPTIRGHRVHHWMLGGVLIPLGLIFESLFVYAVGIGLFIDELMFLLLRGKTHADNYSKVSLVGTIAFVVLVFLARDFFASPFV